jgi:ligand-binding SRPBCC domain-containing protein
MRFFQAIISHNLLPCFLVIITMSKIHQLKSVQRIPASIEEIWTFFSDAHNLSVITPSSIRFQITRDVFGEEVYAGQVITYTVRPLFGIPLSWMTEITHVDKHKFFADDQRKGPYSLWHHQHHFKPIEGGVEMTDLVHYGLPFGWLGGLANGLVVRKKLEEIFTYRYEKIVEHFGGWPGASLQLEIN